MKIQNRVTPWLSFKDKAEEAAAYYTSVIPDSRVLKIVRAPGSEAVMVVGFELGGLPVCALNTGQDWAFTNAFSFSVACESQEEIDQIWAALTDGGQEIQCGWLTDRFGLSWQIVPAQISEWLDDSDPARVGRVMSALLGMVKLDLATLQAAAEGTATP